MFACLAGWVDRRAGWVVLGWVVTALGRTLGAPSASSTGTAMRRRSFPPTGEAIEAGNPFDTLHPETLAMYEKLSKRQRLRLGGGADTA
jgi:hypothetical protein